MLQPLDAVLNKPFKDQLRQMWLAWMSLEDDSPVTKGENIKKPGLSLVLSWVKRWHSTRHSEKSFLKTGIANTLNGSENDQLRYDSFDDEGDQVEESLQLL